VAGPHGRALGSGRVTSPPAAPRPDAAPPPAAGAGTPPGPASVVDPAPAAGPPRPGRRRWGLFALAWAFFGLGVVGAFLPVLPTTPFMLLALWAFSASSPRFHAWLWDHPVFGPPLRRWKAERTLPLWVKGLALGSMAASLAWLGLAVRPPGWVLALAGLGVAAGVAFLASVPTRPRAR